MSIERSSGTDERSGDLAVPALSYALEHREEYGTYWMYRETAQDNDDCNGVYLKKTLFADDQSAPRRIRVRVEWD